MSSDPRTADARIATAVEALMSECMARVAVDGLPAVEAALTDELVERMAYTGQPADALRAELAAEMAGLTDAEFRLRTLLNAVAFLRVAAATGTTARLLALVSTPVAAPDAR